MRNPWVYSTMYKKIEELISFIVIEFKVREHRFQS